MNMPTTGTAQTGAAGEVQIPIPASDIAEAKRAARRVEKSAHRLVQDLTVLSEVMNLGIKVTIETDPDRREYDQEKGTDQT